MVSLIIRLTRGSCDYTFRAAAETAVLKDTPFFIFIFFYFFLQTVIHAYF